MLFIFAKTPSTGPRFLSALRKCVVGACLMSYSYLRVWFDPKAETENFDIIMSTSILTGQAMFADGLSEGATATLLALINKCKQYASPKNAQEIKFKDELRRRVREANQQQSMLTDNSESKPDQERKVYSEVTLLERSMSEKEVCYFRLARKLYLMRLIFEFISLGFFLINILDGPKRMFRGIFFNDQDKLLYNELEDLAESFRNEAYTSNDPTLLAYFKPSFISKNVALLFTGLSFLYNIKELFYYKKGYLGSNPVFGFGNGFTFYHVGSLAKSYSWHSFNAAETYGRTLLSQYGFGSREAYFYRMAQLERLSPKFYMPEFYELQQLNGLNEHLGHLQTVYQSSNRFAEVFHYLNKYGDYQLYYQVIQLFINVGDLIQKRNELQEQSKRQTFSPRRASKISNQRLPKEYSAHNQQQPSNNSGSSLKSNSITSIANPEGTAATSPLTPSLTSASIPNPLPPTTPTPRLPSPSLTFAYDNTKDDRSNRSNRREKKESNTQNINNEPDGQQERVNRGANKRHDRSKPHHNPSKDKKETKEKEIVQEETLYLPDAPIRAEKLQMIKEYRIANKPIKKRIMEAEFRAAMSFLPNGDIDKPRGGSSHYYFVCEHNGKRWRSEPFVKPHGDSSDYEDSNLVYALDALEEVYTWGTPKQEEQPLPGCFGRAVIPLMSLSEQALFVFSERPRLAKGS